jgi:hypothetical protein
MWTHHLAHPDPSALRFCHMKEIEKLTPQNLEAEQSLLGSLLLDKDAIIRVGAILHGKVTMSGMETSTPKEAKVRD